MIFFLNDHMIFIIDKRVIHTSYLVISLNKLIFIQVFLNKIMIKLFKIYSIQRFRNVFKQLI